MGLQTVCGHKCGYAEQVFLLPENIRLLASAIPTLPGNSRTESWAQSRAVIGPLSQQVAVAGKQYFAFDFQVDLNFVAVVSTVPT